MRDDVSSSETWQNDGVPVSHREFYRRMLKRAADEVKPVFPLEVRCPNDGYLRREYQVRVRVMPYWLWRVYRGLISVRVRARMLVTGKCPQCKFEEKAQRW